MRQYWPLSAKTQTCVVIGTGTPRPCSCSIPFISSSSKCGNYLRLDAPAPPLPSPSSPPPPPPFPPGAAETGRTLHWFSWNHTDPAGLESEVRHGPLHDSSHVCVLVWSGIVRCSVDVDVLASVVRCVGRTDTVATHSAGCFHGDVCCAASTSWYKSDGAIRQCALLFCGYSLYCGFYTGIMRT